MLYSKNKKQSIFDETKMVNCFKFKAENFWDVWLILFFEWKQTINVTWYDTIIRYCVPFKKNKNVNKIDIW